MSQKFKKRKMYFKLINNQKQKIGIISM